MTIAAHRLGGAALLALGTLLSVAAPAAADPSTDLLCHSGSAQYCAAAPAQPATKAPKVTPAPASRTYRNCTEVWNAGAGPIRRGTPGYAAHLDRDNDGVGCEKDPR